MSNLIDALHEDGAVAFVWELEGTKTLPDLNSDCFRGDIFLKQGVIHVRLLEEDVLAARDPWKDGPPAALLVMTPHGLALIHHVARRRSDRRLMGASASTRTYECRTVVSIPSDVAASPSPTQLSAIFCGEHVARWANQQALHVSRTLSQGILRRARLDFTDPPPEETSLRPGLELRSSAYWGLRSNVTGTTIDEGWEITAACSASPRPLEDLFTPLWRIQELVGIAFGGAMVASLGRVRYHNASELGALWNAALMTREPQVRASDPQTPRFTLQDLGGLGALRRWVDLCSKHPRAVQPVIAKVRYSATSAAARLLELATAIHYWVSAHRHARWAAKGTYPSHEEALARRVGTAFAGLVGDVSVWADCVRKTHNQLKHDPSFRPDPTTLRFLVWSTELLLEAALLHRIGQTKQAGDRHLRDFRNERAASELRAAIGVGC